MVACESRTSACERSDAEASVALVDAVEYTFSTEVDSVFSSVLDESMALDTEAIAPVAAAVSPVAPESALPTADCAEDFAVPTPDTSVVVESMSVSEELASAAYASALSAAVRRRVATDCTRLSSVVTAPVAVVEDSASPIDEAVSSATSARVCAKVWFTCALTNSAPWPASFGLIPFFFSLT